MKKIYILLTIMLFGVIAYAQNVTQSNVTGIIVPQYMIGYSWDLPVSFYLKVSGLTANTTYRYFTLTTKESDFGTATSGQGRTLFLDASFSQSDHPSLTIERGYSTFTTNALGEYTGWFGIISTASSNYNTGFTSFPTLTIGDETGTTLYRWACDLGFVALQPRTDGASNAGSFLRGTSNATPKNMIALWDNTTGTGNPIAVTPIQGYAADIPIFSPFYNDNVKDSIGSYGVALPNIFENGIRLIRQYSRADGSLINESTSANGMWGTTNTVNPRTGSTALFITSASAPLPVELTSFTSTSAGNAITLNWATATELDNYGFEVERSADNTTFTKVGFVAGAGNSNVQKQYSFVDENLANGTYYYRLKQVDTDGSFEYSQVVSSSVSETPATFSLDQNYPNPFNPSTKISFALAKDSDVKLSVFNTLGEEVAVLINSTLTAGNHSVDFNATNLTSGMYLYKIQAGSFVATKKMVFAK